MARVSHRRRRHKRGGGGKSHYKGKKVHFGRLGGKFVISHGHKRYVSSLKKKH